MPSRAALASKRGARADTDRACLEATLPGHGTSPATALLYWARFRGPFAG
ncbi:hypothetical protein QT381_15245 [Galbitalea sp. SE-J8]|nr:hypothetical protein [Galbitalea sp. SE-J8]MDM4764356.1 hypothetical protein [Galbitalea sp. SE-J8]